MSVRTSITLAYTDRVEVETGVFENHLTLKPVKATREKLYEKRINAAMLDGLQVSARFKVRSNEVTSDLNYVEWRGKKYKVNFVNPQLQDHYTIIELGALM
jgi:hypothetical protein